MAHSLNYSLANFEEIDACAEEISALQAQLRPLQERLDGLKSQLKALMASAEVREHTTAHGTRAVLAYSVRKVLDQELLETLYPGAKEECSIEREVYTLTVRT